MPFLGKPLISRSVERLRELADELLVTTNQPANYAFLGLPLFSDLIPDLGALGGLYTALSVAREPLVAVIACDMPFVQSGLLRAECDLLQHEAVDAVVPRSPEGLEPLHAVYRRQVCLPAIRSALENGERKMTAWFAEVNVRVMEISEVAGIDPDFRSFINLNRPEDFRQAEELARQQN